MHIAAKTMILFLRANIFCDDQTAQMSMIVCDFVIDICHYDVASGSEIMPCNKKRIFTFLR